MAVNRCICKQVQFREIHELASKGGLSFEEIIVRTGCTTGCGLCGPYARIAAITGVCDLPVMRPEQLEVVLEQARSRVVCS